MEKSGNLRSLETGAESETGGRNDFGHLQLDNLSRKRKNFRKVLLSSYFGYYKNANNIYGKVYEGNNHSKIRSCARFLLSNNTTPKPSKSSSVALIETFAISPTTYIFILEITLIPLLRTPLTSTQIIIPVVKLGISCFAKPVLFIASISASLDWAIVS